MQKNNGTYPARFAGSDLTFSPKVALNERVKHCFLYVKDNHLGNVLVTLSDEKIPVDVNNDFIADYYTPDIVSAQDYYPFGMLMPGRNFSTSKYIYSFNGKLKDDNVYGKGNFYNYGFRMYDPRLGRFLSVDPLTKSYPWNSPYIFAGNDVIRAIDLEGLEKYIVTNYYKNGNLHKSRILYVKNSDGVIIDQQATANKINGNVVVYNYSNKNGYSDPIFKKKLTSKQARLMKKASIDKNLTQAIHNSSYKSMAGTLYSNDATAYSATQTYQAPKVAPKQSPILGETIQINAPVANGMLSGANKKQLNSLIGKINASGATSITVNFSIVSADYTRVGVAKKYSTRGYKNVSNFLRENGLNKNISIQPGQVGYNHSAPTHKNKASIKVNK